VLITLHYETVCVYQIAYTDRLDEGNVYIEYIPSGFPQNSIEIVSEKSAKEIPQCPARFDLTFLLKALTSEGLAYQAS